MRLKIAHKLFGSFILILLVVAGTLVLSRLLFQRTFQNYVHQVEQEQISSLVPLLQQEYRTQQGWSHLMAAPERWSRILYRATIEPDFRIPPPPKDHPPTPRGLKICLLDSQQYPLLCPEGQVDIARKVPIEVAGEVVGYLSPVRPGQAKRGLPGQLLERQGRQLTLLIALVIAITALIAFFVAKSLLVPIDRLMKGTRELADRNFNVRIEPVTGDELGLLADHFNRMAGTLARYEKMRRQWLTDISHELRTPLAILRGEIEALQDGIRKPTPEGLASLHAEVQRMSKLVEDLHQLSLADSSHLQVHLQPTRPARILAQVLEAYTPRLEQSDLACRQDLAPVQEAEVLGDGDRLAQVFTNILENCCRYVNSPGKLRIQGRVAQGRLILLFEDSGPGVPEEALPRLFDRLYRVEASRSRESGGSGLGLSICRQIVEAHDGEIVAEAGDRGGLTIRLSLLLAGRTNA